MRNMVMYLGVAFGVLLAGNAAADEVKLKTCAEMAYTCLTGETCIERTTSTGMPFGVCIKDVQFPAPAASKSCKADQDCGPGEMCNLLPRADEGTCMPKAAVPTPQKLPEQKRLPNQVDASLCTPACLPDERCVDNHDHFFNLAHYECQNAGSASPSSTRPSPAPSDGGGSSDVFLGGKVGGKVGVGGFRFASGANARGETYTASKIAVPVVLSAAFALEYKKFFLEAGLDFVVGATLSGYLGDYTMGGHLDLGVEVKPRHHLIVGVLITGYSTSVEVPETDGQGNVITKTNPRTGERVAVTQKVPADQILLMGSVGYRYQAVRTRHGRLSVGGSVWILGGPSSGDKALPFAGGLSLDLGGGVVK